MGRNTIINMVITPVGDMPLVILMEYLSPGMN